jgi:hypothetical protein
MLGDQGSLRSVRDFARKEWPLRGSTTSRSAIADRSHPKAAHPPLAAPFGPSWDEASATATVLICSPYSCWLQHRAWAPYSPERTRHLRPLPGTSPSLHGTDALYTHIDNLLSIGEIQAPRRRLRSEQPVRRASENQHRKAVTAQIAGYLLTGYRAAQVTKRNLRHTAVTAAKRHASCEFSAPGLGSGALLPLLDGQRPGSDGERILVRQRSDRAGPARVPG